MPKCKLRVVLDRPEAIYKPGEMITGRVLVKVFHDCACKSLVVGCQTLNYGRGGTKLGGVPLEQTLFSGGWRAGDDVSFSFQVPAPAGPPTLRQPGHTTEWYVFASARLGLLVSSEAGTPFGLTSNEGETVNFPPPHELDPGTCVSLSSDKRKQAIMLFLVSLPFLIFGPIIIFLCARDLYTGHYREVGSSPRAEWVAMVFGMCLGLVGLPIAARGYKLATRKPDVPSLRRERANARLQKTLQLMATPLAPILVVGKISKLSPLIFVVGTVVIVACVGIMLWFAVVGWIDAKSEE